MKHIRIAASAAAIAILVSACASGSLGSATSAPPSSAAAATSVPSETATSEVNTSASATEQAADTPAALMPLDRLLPVETIEAYNPSYALESQSDSATDAADFAPLDKVRPRTCAEVLKFSTSPIETADGELAGSAGQSAFFEFPGGSYLESLFAYPSATEAQEAFDTATQLLSKCKNASGEWPQQGTIIIDDGIIRERLSIGTIRRLSDTAVMAQGKPGYDGEISDIQGLVLADDAVLWLEANYYDESTNARRLSRFSAFMAQAQEFALTGELAAEPVAQTNDDLTLDCLQIEPLPYELWRNYDEFYGKGRGRDLFVESRVAVTNKCGKTVRGFKYDAEFTDELDETLLSGNASEKLVVKPGQTRKTVPDRGWTIRAVFDADKIKTFTRADPADITVTMTPTKILFTDKTSLP